MIEANPFGPLITPDNIIFRLWAPGAQRVDLLHAEQVRAMPRSDDGWFKLTVPGAKPGDRYRFRINDEIDVPDPASCFQPDDVNGPSEAIDDTYDWQTVGWAGRPWHECIFLELHVGTFSPQGTFRGVIDKLDQVADAGFTALELMPVADFPGGWNWGYDGVLLFAPDSAYGRPDDLKALVDAAHARGLVVFLDVVYNHFGPEGNYLPRYAPQFFSPAQTPWGNAIDYQRPQVRRFAVENALYWLSGRKTIPFVGELERVVGIFHIAAAMVQVVVNPFRQTFNTTNKKLDSKETRVHWHILRPHGALLLITLAGMAFRGFGPRGEAFFMQGNIGLMISLTLYVSWLLFFSCLLCVQRPIPDGLLNTVDTVRTGGVRASLRVLFRRVFCSQ